MQRFTCPDIRRIEVETFDLGPVPDDSILVQNEYTVVSVGTEIHNWTRGGEPGRKPTFPHPTGYCNAGTVLEVGKNVTDIRPGDRVAGQSNHASHAILGPNTFYQKIPDGLSSKSAGFMVMGAIAIHGIRVAHIGLGESVVVMGLGLVGQLAATLAQLSGGLPIIAIDLDKFRLDKARARGIDLCLNPRKIEDLSAAVREHCEEDGANVILEATGKPAVYPTAVKLACTGGRLIALGSPRGTIEMDFLADVHLREVSILGAMQPRTPNEDHIYYRWSKPRDRRLVLRLMAENKLPVEDLITHVAKPEQCQDIYTMLADDPRDVLGVVFEWE
ncbi:MAG: zinc-binding alcohol dehydrogenase [bacterium]|nr:zinc-binding alcohol dehydrogenase [bacterium]